MAFLVVVVVVKNTKDPFINLVIGELSSITFPEKPAVPKHAEPAAHMLNVVELLVAAAVPITVHPVII